MATIDVQDLTLRYGDVTALDGVTFSLRDPGIYGLLGRNASGKTTFLSVLAGFRKATAGAVLLDGRPVFEDPDAMAQVCLIREGGDTVDGSENVEAALSFAQRMRPRWDHDYALGLLERFQLSPKKKVGQLSRGQRAALAVTLGLASRAPVTAFDESYLGMDAPSRYAFYDELLRDYMEHPRTVILSTHHIEEVSSLLEEVVIIDRGRLLMQAEAETLRTRGATVTGPAEAVDRFATRLQVLNERRLGPTKSVVVYGTFDGDHRRQAADAGLEVGPLPLQDLFVHLTGATSSEMAMTAAGSGGATGAGQ